MKKFWNVFLCGILAAVMVLPSYGGNSSLCESARKASYAEISKAPPYRIFVDRWGKVVFRVNYKAKFAYAFVRLYCGVR